MRALGLGLGVRVNLVRVSPVRVTFGVRFRVRKGMASVERGEKVWREGKRCGNFTALNELPVIGTLMMSRSAECQGTSHYVLAT